MELRILCIGDIVGKPGRDLLREHLASIIQEHEIDGVVANAENISGGSGIMPKEADLLFRNGCDALTSGDHVWRKRDIVPYIEASERLIRPANYHATQPGRGSAVVELRNGTRIGVVQVQGRIFMNTQANCPFAAVDREIEKLREETKVIIVDMHAEATSEKIAMGWHLDGRASFIFGTHTHIPTADETVLPKGTAYVTDLGMTGPYESVIGRRVDRVLQQLTTGMPCRFDVAEGDVRLYGAVVTIDPRSGEASEIRRISFRPSQK